MNRVLISMVLVSFLASGLATAHAAKPWDLIIKAQFEQSQINVNERPVIFGTIQDQIGKPVSEAEVKVIFADNSIITKTNSTGNFRFEFGEQASQGTFSVRVSAASKDLKGFATTTIKIGDETSTFGDIYYAKNFEMDSQSKTDPYRELKQKQYQKFVEEQTKKKHRQNEIETKKLSLQEKRDTSIEHRNNAVNATQVGAGTYSGKDYDKYLTKIDPRIRDITAAQMEYTRQLYELAQYEMQKVLDNGGSLQDAKKVYFEKLATSKDEVEKIGSTNNTENHSKIVKKTHDSKVNSKKVKGLKYNKNLK